MRVEQINELADFHVSGRPDFEITGIAYAAGAGETEIAIAENVSELRKTKAQVVLMRPQFVKTEKTLIFAVESLEKAAVMIAEVIEQAINKRLKEVQKNMKESQKAYQSMIAATEKGKNDLSKEQVNCMYKYTISDILFDLMGDEE